MRALAARGPHSRALTHRPQRARAQPVLCTAASLEECALVKVGKAPLSDNRLKSFHPTLHAAAAAAAKAAAPPKAGKPAAAKGSGKGANTGAHSTNFQGALQVRRAR